MSDHAIVRELNIDCLVGPTHFFGGLSFGNIASFNNKNKKAHPKKAALQGLQKMRYLSERGFLQIALPPHDRPDSHLLTRLGFKGSLAQMLRDAHTRAPELVPKLCSSSAMWAANSATVCPRSDSLDQKTHITPANLVTMFHRSLEADFITKIFKKIFAQTNYFTVHDPLPAHDFLSDEGAANHNRLCPRHEDLGLHIFVHGKKTSSFKQATKIYPARQSLLANEALARLHQLRQEQVIFAEQNPLAIDHGAFHNDVVAVANESLFLCHERAFNNYENIINTIRNKYELLHQRKPIIITIKEQELELKNAVSSYLFNSQILSKNDHTMLIFAPAESQHNNQAQQVINRLLEEDNPINEVVYFDISESMANGGGPACLRLRLCLNQEEISAIKPSLFLDKNLFSKLEFIINNYYPEDINLDLFFDNSFHEHNKKTLDLISQALDLGSIYPWQY